MFKTLNVHILLVSLKQIQKNKKEILIYDFEILLEEKKWKIFEINKDLRAHGKGMNVKVRLESLS